MAYTKKRKSRKSLKSTKSASMKSKMASKTRPMSEKQKALQTGYARALIDPKNGPLVGVPTFVPIDTHRIRSKACGVIKLTNAGRIFFNPCAMGTNDREVITAYNLSANGTVDDASTAVAFIRSNAPYTSSQYMVTGADTVHVSVSNITNANGVRSRVVGAIFTVRPISNSQVRDGVMTALHEKHHKTLETFTGADMAVQDNAIVKSCSSGSAVSLLYRPVKPEEVDEFQLSGYRLNGHVFATTGASDGALFDGKPGYMAVEWSGTGEQAFWVESHAIVEYAGEIVTTLAKPPHYGASNKADPNDQAIAGQHAENVEQQQGGTNSDVNYKPGGIFHGGLDPRHDQGPINRPGAAVIVLPMGGTIAVHTGPSEEVTRFTAIPQDSQLVESSYLYEVYRQPNGDFFVWWKGTTVPAFSRQSGKEWAEDYMAIYQLPKDWETALNHIEREYGRESATVHHAGYSRGGGLAEYMGGTGYGAWTPYSVQTTPGFHDEKAGDFIHDRIVMPMSKDMRGEGLVHIRIAQTEGLALKKFLHFMGL